MMSFSVCVCVCVCVYVCVCSVTEIASYVLQRERENKAAAR